MDARVDYARVSPGALRAVAALEKYVREETTLEPELLELVKLRASQINGCAYCIDMHTKDARSRGMSEQRLYLTTAWREAPVYSERERAAFAWTEAVTLVSRAGVPHELHEQARAHFSEKELVDLTFAVIAINGWNRLAISFRADVGSYQPATSLSTAPAT